MCCDSCPVRVAALILIGPILYIQYLHAVSRYVTIMHAGAMVTSQQLVSLP